MLRGKYFLFHRGTRFVCKKATGEYMGIPWIVTAGLAAGTMDTPLISPELRISHHKTLKKLGQCSITL